VCIQEVDRRERVNLCLSLQDLRNNYFILWDSITKNLDKIKKPRSSVEMPFS
jgi:proteasome activator subunit 3 (PA28 gamma)